MDYNSIINSNNVVLVEFFATWCPHCKRMIPVMEEVKKLLGNRVPVYTIDIDENEKKQKTTKSRPFLPSSFTITASKCGATAGK